jgi:hypothetical protein
MSYGNHRFPDESSGEFKHSKLNKPDAEIRIAVLQPGTFDDPIVVRFDRRELAVLTLSGHGDGRNTDIAIESRSCLHGSVLCLGFGRASFTR